MERFARVLNLNHLVSGTATSSHKRRIFQDSEQLLRLCIQVASVQDILFKREPMCIFHETLSTDEAFELSSVIVALSAFQKGSTLFAEIAALRAKEAELNVGAGAATLVAVSKDPYRYLRALTSFEPDHGHGGCAVKALTRELEKGDSRQFFFDAVSPSSTTHRVLQAPSIEAALREVAMAGHSHRPAFLEWFRDNPSCGDAPRAIKVLEEVATGLLVALPPLPAIPHDLGHKVAADPAIKAGNERPHCCQP
jgi:hypothetical protein